MNINNLGVDIIIPIYNAYEDLVKCILSIWEHTDLAVNRLILVNDKSPDKRIETYINSIAGKNIIVHNSIQNGGFSASVNIGIQYSTENDVILLNSDTIVTPKWLEKIKICAYSDEFIGTVTPLSNSATLASYPIFGQDNALPENVTVNEMAEIVERCSYKKYPQIPVAVGFCMYIKRCVINEIGLFDAETFGRGYGEENDFCYRAELMGYKHVLCDNAFVFHKGTGSFMSDQKKKLIDEHVEILEKRYPVAMRNTHLYCMENPHQYIRDNITKYLNLFNRKKNILYILHNDFRDDVTTGIGGTQLHVKDLTENLKRNYNIYILLKEKNSFKLVGYVNSEQYEFDFEDYNISSYPLFRSKHQAKVLEEIIMDFHIDLIHVHHISTMSLEVYYVANKLNIPLITSIHDFYMICPTYFLYNVNCKFCSGNNNELCQTCLYERIGIHFKGCYITKWQTEMLKALNLSGMIIYPSNSAKQVVENVYSLEVPSKVLGHGSSPIIEKPEIITDFYECEGIECNIEKIDLVNSNIIEGWAFFGGVDNRNIRIYVQLIRDGKVLLQVKAQKNSRLDVDEAFHGTGNYIFSGFQARILKQDIDDGMVSVRVLLVKGDLAYAIYTPETILLQRDVINSGTRVAFIGGLSAIKGSTDACELIKAGTDIQWFIFGNIDPIEELASLEKQNLHKFGAYNREDIHSLLTKYKIDIVCILSKCSETFCYTLSEAWEAGVPVIGYDIGAVGERIKATGAGIVFPMNYDIDKILSKIRNYHTDLEFESVKKQLKNLVLKTGFEMSQQYMDLYNEMLNI